MPDPRLDIHLVDMRAAFRRYGRERNAAISRNMAKTHKYEIERARWMANLMERLRELDNMLLSNMLTEEQYEAVAAEKEALQEEAELGGPDVPELEALTNIGFMVQLAVGSVGWAIREDSPMTINDLREVFMANTISRFLEMFHARLEERSVELSDVFEGLRAHQQRRRRRRQQPEMVTGA